MIKVMALKYDMKIKRAQYITQNNELSQEFSFCHPRAQFHLNQVYFLDHHFGIFSAENQK